MRKVLSISITELQEKEIKRKTKLRGFNSVSDYIKNLLVIDDDMISEKELLEDIKSGQDDYKKGKIIRAKSIADLVKNADKYRAQLNGK
jgi:Arc/MetJ-type ribon-helix-helix transcriptional regulator